MADKIKCTIEVDVGGTLKVTAARTISVESYSKVEVEVPPALSDGSPSSVEITLPAAASSFEFLLITSNLYGLDVAYSGDGSPDGSLSLDGPLLLFGGGVAEALSTSPINSLTFANANSETTAHVQIIIGMNVAS